VAERFGSPSKCVFPCRCASLATEMATHLLRLLYINENFIFQTGTHPTLINSFHRSSFRTSCGCSNNIANRYWSQDVRPGSLLCPRGPCVAAFFNRPTTSALHLGKGVRPTAPTGPVGPENMYSFYDDPPKLGGIKAQRVSSYRQIIHATRVIRHTFYPLSTQLPGNTSKIR
jgi:hypothetical protein